MKYRFKACISVEMQKTSDFVVQQADLIKVSTISPNQVNFCNLEQIKSLLYLIAINHIRIFCRKPPPSMASNFFL